MTKKHKSVPTTKAQYEALKKRLDKTPYYVINQFGGGLCGEAEKKAITSSTPPEFCSFCDVRKELAELHSIFPSFENHVMMKFANLARDISEGREVPEIIKTECSWIETFAMKILSIFQDQGVTDEEELLKMSYVLLGMDNETK